MLTQSDVRELMYCEELVDSLFLGLKQEKSRLYPHGVQVSTYKWPSSTDTAQFAADHLAFIKEVEAHIRNSEGKKPSEISLPWEEMRVQSRLPFFFRWPISWPNW